MDDEKAEISINFNVWNMVCCTWIKTKYSLWESFYISTCMHTQFLSLKLEQLTVTFPLYLRICFFK